MKSHETQFKGAYEKSVLNTIFQAYRPALNRAIFFLGLGFIGRVVLLGNSNLMGYWADSFCAPSLGLSTCRELPGILQNLESGHFVFLLAAATGIGFLFTVIFRVGLSRLSAEAVSFIYDETTLRASRFPMSFFDQTPSGRVMTRFSSDYNNIFRIFGGPLAEFITLVFDLLAMAVLITIASPWLLPVWITQGLLNYTLYRIFRPALRRERREQARRRSPGIAHFSESANGTSTIRAYGKESVFEKRFTKLNQEFLIQKRKTSALFTRFSVATSAVTAFMLLFTGLVCIWLSRSGRISVGSIGVAFVYLGLSSGILQSFFEWLGQFEEAMTGLERMNEYLRMDIERGARLPASAKMDTGHRRMTDTSIRRLNASGAGISLRNLSMRYRSGLPLVLENISLEIEAGERVAIIGKTGSGKTSLVQALFRLYPIDSGTIQIGGMSAKVDELGPSDGLEVDLQSYRSLLSYITQEAILFTGSLRENLDPTGLRSDLALMQSLHRVQFTDQGNMLDLPVEEKGRNFSSGERQLICMARCLLEERPVVVLDEATSAVDPKSEEILTRATEEFFKGKTQIIIAHRLSTIRYCDRVVWLEAGRIRRVGKPEDVLPEFEGADLGT
jgi:ABC-type multidrug transport system fused ATPase/permease subunit